MIPIVYVRTVRCYCPEAYLYLIIIDFVMPAAMLVVLSIRQSEVHLLMEFISISVRLLQLTSF